MDESVDLHSAHFLPRFGSGMHAAIVHVDFHHHSDRVSSVSLALLVSAFQYLITEVFFIIFLALMSIDKPRRAGSSEQYRDHRFFDHIVGDTLGTISSRARANIAGDL
jgi:hypothetical protein